MAFLKPIKGALVRYPQTMTPLAEDGAEVSLDGGDGNYWRRRINDGSVVIVPIINEQISPMVQAIEQPGVQPESKPERGGRNR